MCDCNRMHSNTNKPCWLVSQPNGCYSQKILHATNADGHAMCTAGVQCGVDEKEIKRSFILAAFLVKKIQTNSNRRNADPSHLLASVLDPQLPSQ